MKLESFGAFEPLKLRPRTPDEQNEARAVLNRFADQTRSQIKVRSGPWRDLAVRKRPTEVGPMVGWVIEEGRRRGVTMPLNEALVQQVKELERGTRQRGCTTSTSWSSSARSFTLQGWVLTEGYAPMRAVNILSTLLFALAPLGGLAQDAYPSKPSRSSSPTRPAGRMTSWRAPSGRSWRRTSARRW